MSIGAPGNQSSQFSQKLWERTFFGWCLRKCFAIAWRSIPFIPEGALLWRAVHKQEFLYADGSGLKPGFFRDKGGLSVDVAALSTVKKSLRGYARPPTWPIAGVGLAQITTEDARACGTDVVHKPERMKTPEIKVRNYSHAEFTACLETDRAEDLCKKTTFTVKPQRELLRSK